MFVSTFRSVVKETLVDTTEAGGTGDVELSRMALYAVCACQK